MSAAIAAAVGRVVAGVAAVVVAPSLLICRHRRRRNKGTGRSAGDSIDILHGEACCGAGGKDAHLTQRLSAIRDIYGAAHAKRTQKRQIKQDGSLDAVEGRRMVQDVKEGRVDSPRVRQDLPTADYLDLSPERWAIAHPQIEKVLDLIEEAHALEDDSSGRDVPSLQRAAFKYREAVYTIKSFVEQLERRGGYESADARNSMKGLVEEIEQYEMKAEELDAQARSSASSFLDGALASEVSSSARDSEPRPLPPTEGEVYDDDTSSGVPSQESVAKCHEMISYTKSRVKQLDRQGGSYESIMKQCDSREKTWSHAEWFTEQGWEEEEEDDITLDDHELFLDGDDHPDSESIAGIVPQCEPLLAQESTSDEPPHSTSVSIACPLIEKQRSGSRKSSNGFCTTKKTQAKKKKTNIKLPPPKNNPRCISDMSRATQKKNRSTKIDRSQQIEPSQDDVLCGRGEHTNKNRGNIRYREKARELRPRYLQGTNEEKKNIIEELIKTVTVNGYHFLKKEGKNWYKIINPEVKVGQLLREKSRKKNDMMEQSAPASPSSVAMIGQHSIEPVGIESEEWKNGHYYESLSTEFFDETMTIDDSTKCQPHLINHRRVIDVSRPIKYTEGDVLFGRGEAIKNHQGNILFRENARELLPRYLNCSKDDKTKVAEELMDTVTRNGHHFLEKGPDGNWYNVLGNAPRRKASQAFRDAFRAVVTDVQSIIKEWPGDDDPRSNDAFRVVYNDLQSTSDECSVDYDSTSDDCKLDDDIEKFFDCLSEDEKKILSLIISRSDG
ncbi:hypothetical protein ACHAXA_010255 [Cyclostephanos tholiformis]|uniref:DUF6824 domain-containing protein n=1 Tax=Cyclostephanos tholiformis TaxID=382380 RepID=A0ABD3RV02_9STRA